eukprot:325401_1
MSSLTQTKPDTLEKAMSNSVDLDIQTPDNQNIDELPEFKVYKTRFLICFAYILNTVVNAWIWIGFAPIQARSVIYFNVSEQAINWFSIIFMLTYIPASLLCAYTFQYYGLRISFIFASSFEIFGSIIRFIGSIIHSFGLVFFGQFLCSLSQPYFTNSPARIAVEWFSKDGRDLATALLSTINPLGIGIGSVCSTIFVGIVKKDDNLFGFNGLMFSQIILSLIAFIVTYICFYDKPPTPPSLSQHLKIENINIENIKIENTKNNIYNLLNECKLLLYDKQFVLLFFGFGIGVGLFNALTTLINQYTACFSYSTDDAGLFGGVLIFGGLFGSIIAGVLMEITRSYRILLKVSTVLTFVFLIILISQLRKDNFIGVLIIFGLFGFVALPIVPLTYECAAECTYPLNEEFTCGMLMSSGQIFGIIFLLIWGSQIPPKYNNQLNFSSYFMGIIAFFMLVLLLLFKGEYKRLTASN